MPNQDVRGLEVRAMKFEHSDTGQSAQHAGDQSRGSRLDREAAAKQQPAQQSGGDRMEKTGEQTYNAGREEMVGVVVVE